MALPHTLAVVCPSESTCPMKGYRPYGHSFFFYIKRPLWVSPIGNLYLLSIYRNNLFFFFFKLTLIEVNKSAFFNSCLSSVYKHPAELTKLELKKGGGAPETRCVHPQSGSSIGVSEGSREMSPVICSPSPCSLIWRSVLL